MILKITLKGIDIWTKNKAGFYDKPDKIEESGLILNLIVSKITPLC